MSYVEIEVRARTVELAIEAAMGELGVDDREQLAVEILQEPEKGFLGFGGQDAVVRVKRRRPRRRRNEKRRSPQDNRGNNRSETSGSGNSRGRQGRSQSTKNDGNRQTSQSKGRGRDMNRQDRDEQPRVDDRPVLTIDDQARIAAEFLEGLVAAYGLEGTVTTKVEEDVIIADVNGDQTEALVGVRGTVRSAIHELTRTVMQRYAQDTARLRLDIAGYAERRRQALTIYAQQLIDQLLAEGGEIMLEPMSPSDRKVIHDAAAANPSVRSYSEGEAPRRYVVLTRIDDEGTEAFEDDESDDSEAPILGEEE